MSDDQRTFVAETIHFGYRPTPAGLAGIAASRRGVAAILLGTDRHELSRKLAEALPGADLVKNETAIISTLATVAHHIGSPAEEPGFDLDLRGDAREIAV